ncbi:MAG: chalcone isomerase family protein [Opitutales bacterium]|jgi:hypothetical protein
MKTWLQLILFIVSTSAATGEVDVSGPIGEHIPTAARVGDARVAVLVWDLYDITLYGPAGSYNPEAPFAIEINYLRNIEGDLISRKSVEEMRRQGISEVKLAAWYEQMNAIFPDVKRGSRLTGIFLPGSATLFYNEDGYIGRVMDPSFGEPFSRIWLGEGSSLSGVRARLTGGSGG